MSTKADTSGSKTITVIREVSLNPSDAYSQAPFVAGIPSGSQSAPGYGFHSVGKEGGYLYLRNGNLYLLLRDGDLYKIDMTIQQ